MKTTLKDCAHKVCAAVRLLDADCRAHQFDLTDQEQIDCLSDPERRDEAIGMLEDLLARCGMQSAATVAKDLFGVDIT